MLFCMVKVNVGVMIFPLPLVWPSESGQETCTDREKKFIFIVDDLYRISATVRGTVTE